MRLNLIVHRRQRVPIILVAKLVNNIIRKLMCTVLCLVWMAIRTLLSTFRCHTVQRRKPF